MSVPKRPFEAAVRAACPYERWNEEHPEKICRCSFCTHLARAALAAALPLDPAPDEVSEAIGLAVHDVHEFPAKTYLVRVGQAARRAIRASLLPGEEPS